MRAIKQKIIITGSSSGIGLALTQYLLEHEYTVIGIARHHDNINIRHKHYTAIHHDLSDTQKSDQLFKQLSKDHSDINSIIFNAGYGQFGHLEEFSSDQIINLMNVNFISHALLAKYFLPVMKKIKKGKLIFIGSEAALKGSQKGAIYCASKFAIRGFAQALQEECSRSSIQVSLINPGMVRTPFYETLAFEPGDNEENTIPMADIVNTLKLILDSGQSSVFNEINLSPIKKVIKFK